MTGVSDSLPPVEDPPGPNGRDLRRCPRSGLRISGPVQLASRSKPRSFLKQR